MSRTAIPGPYGCWAQRSSTRMSLAGGGLDDRRMGGRVLQRAEELMADAVRVAADR